MLRPSLPGRIRTLNTRILSSHPESVIDSPLSQYTLRIRVFHLAHLRHQVRNLGNLRVGVAPGANHVHTLRTILQRFRNNIRIEHTIADGVTDFIEYHQIVVSAVNGVASGLP